MHDSFVPPRSLRWGFLGLLALYLILGVSYAAAVPVLEAPDESSHLQVIRYIRLNRRLPPYQIPERRADSGAGMAWVIGYHDPPLYYAPPLYHALGAVLTAWTGMEDLPARLIPSPSWEAGHAPQRGPESWNKNVFVHLPGASLTQSQTVQAAALLRAFSLLLGGVTIFCAYEIARML